MNCALVRLHHTHVEAASSAHYTSSTLLYKHVVYSDVPELRSDATTVEKFIPHTSLVQVKLYLIFTLSLSDAGLTLQIQQCLESEITCPSTPGCC